MGPEVSLQSSLPGSSQPVGEATRSQPPLSLAPNAGAWMCDLSCLGPYPTKGYTIPPLPPPRLVQGSTESDEEVGWEEDTEGSLEVIG